MHHGWGTAKSHMVVHQKPSAPFWDLHRVMLRKLRAGAVGAAVFCRFNAVEVSEEGSHTFMPCIACSSGVLHPLGGTRLGREVVKQRERQHFTPGPAFAGPAMDAAAPAAVSLPPAPPRSCRWEAGGVRRPPAPNHLLSPSVAGTCSCLSCVYPSPLLFFLSFFFFSLLPRQIKARQERAEPQLPLDKSLQVRRSRLARSGATWPPRCTNPAVQPGRGSGRAPRQGTWRWEQGLGMLRGEGPASASSPLPRAAGVEPGCSGIHRWLVVDVEVEHQAHG